MANDSYKETFNRLRDAIIDLKLTNLKEIGDYIAKRIVQQARAGKTMAYGPEAEKLKPLKDTYIHERKVRQAKGDFTLDPDFFSPARSNVTLTGEFLRSVSCTEVDQANATITVAPSEEKHGQDKITNKQLGGYLSEQGRSIFGLDKTGRKVVAEMVKREIKALMRKNILRK